MTSPLVKPVVGIEHLVEVRQDQLAAVDVDRHAFSHPVASSRSLVGSDAAEHGLAQPAVDGPIGELDLDHHRRLDPVHASGRATARGGCRSRQARSRERACVELAAARSAPLPTLPAKAAGRRQEPRSSELSASGRSPARLPADHDELAAAREAQLAASRRCARPAGR